ncbi:alpha-ketoglutarate-dependent dioxygenase alkB homolog 7, mitochondrial [Colletes gigas]|uniref:alpha-ketoglutarate-dependent dioxygenase alkB homolog 7, mitochondrial n=1 Tax=Colletes gigas TaxID=935657 RepID=UPI001C9ABDA6|nr:alpha-ketoglutarate-dependent dioxygenase alkB homolog 7, mitochondrial [Colletes gigas]
MKHFTMTTKFFSLKNFVIGTFDRINLKHYSRSAIVCTKINTNAENWQEKLCDTMQIVPNFVDIEEEKSLLEEVEPYMKTLRYEKSHWDDAIHFYRETERKQWNENNMKIINKIREKAFPKEMSQIPLIHILDLAAEGWIKPHVDSIRFCGEIIAGLSLLSDSIMRLTMVGNETTYKHDFLLPQRSLYIMSGVARYNYNHEILKNEESYFEGQHIPKTRRISIICRCQPENSDN